MAARVVNGWTAYIDQAQLYQRHDVLVTSPNATLNDQQFCLEVENVLFSNCLMIGSTTSAVYVTLDTFRFKGRDLCGVAATENSFWYVYAYASSAGNFSVKIDDGTHNSAIAVVANTTSKIWRGSTTQVLNCGQDDIITIDVSAKRDSGAGTVYIVGLGIYSGT